MTATAISTDEDMRDRILGAAEECIARYGVPKTTIADVIKRAGVARATLYKYVPGGRDEIIVEVLIRQGRRNTGVVLEAIARAESLQESITDGILAAVERIQADEHLAYLFSPEIIGPASRLQGAGARLVEVTAELVGPVLEAGRRAGQVPADLDNCDAAEWTLRVFLSLLAFEGPSGRSKAQLREFVRRFAVAPLLTRPAREVTSDAPKNPEKRYPVR